MARMRADTRSLLGAMACLIAAVCLTPARAQDADQTPWPTKAWLTSTPEAQGMDSAALARLVGYGAANSFDSLIVVRHGRIVTEAYYAPYGGDVPHQIFSSTKAVIGTLLAMAYKDGLLDRLDRPMLDFFDDRHVANVDEKKKAITIQNLLDMTSGLDWDQGFEGGKQQTMMEEYRSANWTQFVLDRPMAHTPGEVYNYSNGNPDLVSAIITRATGRLAEDYARQKLFAPLGIVDWHWDRGAEGLTAGQGFLYLLPRDMAKFGYLYLHHGEWEGKRLLPDGWADVLDHKLVNTHATYDPNQSYSDFFWVFPNKRVFMANGKNGQLIVVFPDLDVVAATTARKQLHFNAMIDAVAGAVKSEAALPANPDAAAQLADAIKDAAVEKPSPVGPTPELAAAISGRTYKFPDNVLKVRSLILDLTGPRPHVVFEQYFPNNNVTPSVTYEAPIGIDGLYAKSPPSLTASGRISAVKGTWIDAQTFVIDAPSVGYGEQQRFILTFSGKKLTLRRTVAVGEGFDASAEGEQAD